MPRARLRAITVHLHSLDLDQEPAEVLAQIRGIAGAIRATTPAAP